ncbi:MAG: arginine deiminase-related protein [Nitrospirota bacterium]
MTHGRSLLMCPPDYYGIEYEINPWMDVRRPADPDRARAQWRALYDLLTAGLGVHVDLLEPVKGLPDLVFTANAGMVAHRRFIASRFLHPERQREQPTYEAWFRTRGYAIDTLPEQTCFEGEGDALWLGDTLFAGYRLRSDVTSHQAVAAILGCRVLSLELIDPRFYHLDTCFCPLDERRALYYPPAFDEYGQRVIAQFVPEAIAVDEADALRFGCNAIVAGREVVLQSGCAALEASLRAAGWTPRPVDLSEFHKAGGSAKCLVLWVE